MPYNSIKFRLIIVKLYYALHETSQEMENENKNKDRPLDQTPFFKDIGEQSVEKVRSIVKV